MQVLDLSSLIILHTCDWNGVLNRSCIVEIYPIYCLTQTEGSIMHCGIYPIYCLHRWKDGWMKCICCLF